MEQYFNALQKVRGDIVNPHSPKLVKTDKITHAIKIQQYAHTKYCNDKYANTDPHSGLKLIFSDAEEIRLCHSIMWLSSRSTDLFFACTFGRNAAVCGASMRVMRLCDLNISTGFGPEEEAPRNKTLLLVVRKGDYHKDRYATNRQVGVQRHRDYRRCAVFATALRVIKMLQILHGQIDFSHPDTKLRNKWWDLVVLIIWITFR
jgi:hypothetical protein